jgi:PKD repeat protein
MKKLLPLLLLAFLSTTLSAQKQLKLTAITKTAENDLSKKFSEYGIVSLPIADLNKFVKSNNKSFSNIALDVPSFGVFELEIFPYDIISPDYTATIITNSGKQIIDNPGVITYRGSLKNIPNSKVFLTITDDCFFGSIFDGYKEYMVEPLGYLKENDKTANAFVFYETSKVTYNTDNVCGVTDVQNVINNNNTANQQRVEGVEEVVGCRQIELAIASDSYMYLRYASDASKILTHNIGIINMVNSVYMNSQFSTSIEFIIKGQSVSALSTTDQMIPNTYPNSTDASYILSAFRQWGEAGNFGFSYDLAQFWTVRSMGVARGMAYLGSLCSTGKYALTSDLEYSDPSGSNIIVRNMAAHEFGHSLSIQHDTYPYSGFYIMGASLSYTAHLSLNPFSPQSVNYLNNYFATNSLSCLTSCETNNPIVDFAVFPAVVCVGATAQITDKTLRGPTSWNWTLPTATTPTSTMRNPTVTYNTAGLKSISLSASNSMGTVAATKNIVVSLPPTVTCNPGGLPFSPDGSGLKLFNLAGIHNLTENSTYDYNTYKDFSCTRNTVLSPSTLYRFNAYVGNSTNPNPLDIYVDYNNDGDFLDANELVYTSGTFAFTSFAQETFTTIATPPVYNQMLRMRVIARDQGTTATPCPTVLIYGQVEDYGITFVQANPLPITLLSFDVKKINNDVKLIWKTSQEIDFSHFIIEKSINGIDFKPFASVNSNSSKNYELIVDEHIRPTTIYYRLKMMDANGQFSYSKIVYYYWDADNEIIKIENPCTNGVIKVFTTLSNPLFNLYDTKGARITLQLTSKETKKFVLQTNNVSTGIYFLKIEAEGKTYFKKLVLQ